jgi:hypothetical protein
MDDFEATMNCHRLPMCVGQSTVDLFANRMDVHRRLLSIHDHCADANCRSVHENHATIETNIDR